MAGIFTRPKVLEILNDDSLGTDERLDRIMSLRGRDLDDGYVTKAAAKADKDAALESARTEWESSLPKPDIKASEEYRNLASEFAGYKAMQEAKGSEVFKDVKGKFFDTVYGMVDRADGAAPVEEQLAKIRENYEEYFTPRTAGGETPKNTPQYSQNPGRPGVNPDSEEDKLYKQLSQSWT